MQSFKLFQRFFICVIWLKFLQQHCEGMRCANYVISLSSHSCRRGHWGSKNGDAGQSDPGVEPQWFRFKILGLATIVLIMRLMAICFEVPHLQNKWPWASWPFVLKVRYFMIGGCSLLIKMVKWASLVAQMVNNSHAMQNTWVQSLGRKDPVEEETATHSSILAWRIPWTEEPGGL